MVGFQAPPLTHTVGQERSSQLRRSGRSTFVSGPHRGVLGRRGGGSPEPFRGLTANPKEVHPSEGLDLTGDDVGRKVNRLRALLEAQRVLLVVAINYYVPVGSFTVLSDPSVLQPGLELLVRHKNQPLA
jgi:hypothetical protein